MSTYTPVTPIAHDLGCRRGSLRHAPGRLDFKSCSRCAELWRRIGGDPQGDHDGYLS